MTFKPLSEGIHAGVPMSQYIGDPAPEPSLSKGVAKVLLEECPARAWYCHPRLNPDLKEENNDATDAGSIAHDLLLEGHNDRLVIIDAKDWRTNAAKEARQSAYDAGKIPILVDKYPKIEAMVKQARLALDAARKEIGFSFDVLQAERTMLWKNGDVWCRARPDLLTPDFKLMIEYKTTEGLAEPNAFSKKICDMGYDLQGALVRDGIHTLMGWTPDVVFLVQETEAPYLCSLVGMSPMYTEIAEKKLERAIGRWRECITTGKWPGYPSQVAWVEPPAWEIQKAEFLALTK